MTQTGFGPDREPVRPGCVLRRSRLLQALNAWYRRVGRRRSMMKKLALSALFADVRHGHALGGARDAAAAPTSRRGRRRCSPAPASSTARRPRAGARRCWRGRSTPAGFNGVPLDGLAVVAAVSGDANLSVHEIGGEVANTRTALFVDARATEAQRTGARHDGQDAREPGRRHASPKSRPRRSSSSPATTTSESRRRRCGSRCAKR